MRNNRVKITSTLSNLVYDAEHVIMDKVCAILFEHHREYLDKVVLSVLVFSNNFAGYYSQETVGQWCGIARLDFVRYVLDLEIFEFVDEGYGTVESIITKYHQAVSSVDILQFFEIVAIEVSIVLFRKFGA